MEFHIISRFLVLVGVPDDKVCSIDYAINSGPMMPAPGWSPTRFPFPFVGPAPPTCRLPLIHFNPLTGIRASWLVLLLPYIEEQALFDGFDLAIDMLNQGPEALQARTVSIYLCPSDATNAHSTFHQR